MNDDGVTDALSDTPPPPNGNRPYVRSIVCRKGNHFFHAQISSLETKENEWKLNKSTGSVLCFVRILPYKGCQNKLKVSMRQSTLLFVRYSFSWNITISFMTFKRKTLSKIFTNRKCLNLLLAGVFVYYTDEMVEKRVPKRVLMILILKVKCC